MKTFVKLWLSDILKYDFLKKNFLLFISLFSCYLIVLFAIFSYEYSFEKDKIENSTKKDLNAVHDLLKEKFDRTEMVIKRMIHEIKKNHQDKEYIFKMMEIYKTEPYFVDNLFWTVFSWTDENDDIIVDTKYGIMENPYDLSMRDYIKFTKKYPNKFFIGKPVFGSTSKKWMIPGGVGAYLNKEYIGSMTIGLQLNALSNILRRKIKNEKLNIYLTDSNQKIIFKINRHKIQNYQNDFFIKDKKMSDLISKTNNSEEIKIRINILNKENIILAKKVEKYPLFILAEYDKTEVKKNLIKSYINKAIVSFLILIVLFIIILSLGYNSYNEYKKGE